MAQETSDHVGSGQDRIGPEMSGHLDGHLEIFKLPKIELISPSKNAMILLDIEPLFFLGRPLACH